MKSPDSRILIERLPVGARACVLIGLALLAGCAGKDAAAPPEPAAPAAAPSAPTREQLLSATVSDVFHAPVTLEGGRYPGPAGGRASRATLVLRKDKDHSVRYVRLRKI